MKIGNTEVRAMGGGPGCLAMLVGSLVVSVVLTVLLNLIIR